MSVPSELVAIDQPQTPQEPWTQENPAPAAPRSVAFHVFPQDVIEQARAQHQYLKEHLPLVERAVQVGEANKVEYQKVSQAIQKMAADLNKPVPRAVCTNAELAASFISSLLSTEIGAAMSAEATVGRARALVAEFRKFYPSNSF